MANNVPQVNNIYSKPCLQLSGWRPQKAAGVTGNKMDEAKLGMFPAVGWAGSSAGSAVGGALCELQ